MAVKAEHEGLDEFNEEYDNDSVESVEAAEPDEPTEDPGPQEIHFQDMGPGGELTVLGPASQELEQFLGCAALLSVSGIVRQELPLNAESTAHLSFPSLIGALAYAQDPMSQWLRRTTQEHGEGMLTALRSLGATQAPEELQTEDFYVRPFFWTRSARRALTEANELRRRFDAAPFYAILDVRHLIAALLFLPDYHDVDFEKMRLDRQQLRKDFVHFVASEYPREAVGWEALLNEDNPPARQQTASHPSAPTHPLSWMDNEAQRTLYSPRYDADGRESKDLLRIDRDVDALSALIASRTMTPPLSIGVFGEWGSGKSFFMHHLRRRVDELADRASKSQRHQREVAFYKNIIQIEFNAWHYSEGNLWASLVEHIFRNLRKTPGETEEEVGKRRNALLKRLARREASLLRKEEMVIKSEAQVARAGTKVEELEQQKRLKQSELEKLQEKKHSALRTLPSTLQLAPELRQKAISLLKELGFNSLGRTAFELKGALSDARTELYRADGFIASLLDTRGQGTRLRVPALILVLSVCASLGLSFGLNWLGKQDLSEISARVTMLVGIVGTATTWLRRQTQWLRERREQSEKTLRAVELAIENERQQRLKPLDEAVQSAKDDVTAIEQQQVEHQKSLARAQKAVRTLKKELSDLSNARLLDKFIESRTGSDDYRKHLGLIALIRRDFEELSRLMEAVNRDEQTDLNIPPINRIVLYIDDLDRCSQDTVVEVLQAVHLLLAFPLFVVVVGVDSRWVARCLNHTFKNLLKQDDTNEQPEDPMTPGATAYDYLEKIFQIPIWLRPIGADRRTNMVRGLLASHTSDEHSTGAKVLELKPELVANHGTTIASPAAQVGRAQNRSPEPKAETSHGKPKTSTPSNEAHVPPTEQEELDPPGLVISEEELAFIDCLGPLLNPTPRVLKRFANTYRLIKTCVPSTGQAAFTGNGQEGGSPYQVCLMLLALVTSRRERAEKFFALLKQFAHDKEILTLHALLIPSRKLSGEADLVELFYWLDTMPPEFQLTPLSLVRKLVPWVTRFSFWQAQSTNDSRRPSPSQP
ncbi:hypothetical protein HUA78_22310 [Myxococcus sp. CA033]|uniref:P-loop NTPase fold protein n=1 Tax=Myxococcus sp. CA033 TaxID=2741516 RepID=UPI00157B95EB|nr:P-loop NTPase fold protein [Myxococcus sp. CA033]NTX37188.1 hypothetical protein [Myxococcus sp. CA033]